MKNWFNGKGTITGWQSVGRMFVALLIYVSGAVLAEYLALEYGGAFMLVMLPFLVFNLWLNVTISMKRYRAFGWEGKWYNIIFPYFTDAHYSNGKQEEK